MSTPDAGRTCWYCNSPAVAVWHTTWDAPGRDWGMCDTCQSRVRRSLTLRRQGRHQEADALDNEHGIDTSCVCGAWIDPASAP